MSVFTDLSKYDSLEEKYFSIDDILATQERLTTTFEIDVPNMGFLSVFSIFIKTKRYFRRKFSLLNFSTINPYLLP